MVECSHSWSNINISIASVDHDIKPLSSGHSALTSIFSVCEKMSQCNVYPDSCLLQVRGCWSVIAVAGCCGQSRVMVTCHRVLLVMGQGPSLDLVWSWSPHYPDPDHLSILPASSCRPLSLSIIMTSDPPHIIGHFLL